MRNLGQFSGQFHDIFLVHIANHRDQQAAIGVHGDADVDVLLVNDLFLRHVNTGIELRENFQGGSADFQCDRRHRHLATRFFRLGRKTRAQLFQFGDVGLVLLGDVRDRGPGFPKMLGRLAPHTAHGDALHFPEFGEIGKRWLGEMTGLRRLCRRGRSEQRFGVSLDVIFADASTGAAAFHPVNVHPKLPR